MKKKIINGSHQANRNAATTAHLSDYKKPYIFDHKEMYQALKKVPPDTDIIVIGRANIHFDYMYAGVLFNEVVTKTEDDKPRVIKPDWLVTSQYKPKQEVSCYWEILTFDK